MIQDKFIDLYARNSGLRDKLIAERDVVLTYALHALVAAKLMDHLAFKGGTCLRKTVFGSSGRFSEDLDFTLDSNQPEDDVLVALIEEFNREHHGISFLFEEYYKTVDEMSFGGDVRYSHAWNDSGRFNLQVSLRERPTLPVAGRELKHQVYFDYIEFEAFEVRSLDPIEMIAEKIRAAFQRTRVRDLYDLYRFASIPFNGELLRKLVVLKLWQVHDPFDPDIFFRNLRGGNYDWYDLQRLIRDSVQIEPKELLESVENRFAILCDLSELEREVIADAKSGWNDPLANRLRSEILRLAKDSYISL